MALPPEAAEALDDSTSPERLAEIARTHPVLQPLIAANPACPEDTRRWILAHSDTAAAMHQASIAQGDGAPREERTTGGERSPQEDLGADVPTEALPALSEPTEAMPVVPAEHGNAQPPIDAGAPRVWPGSAADAPGPSAQSSATGADAPTEVFSPLAPEGERRGGSSAAPHRPAFPRDVDQTPQTAPAPPSFESATAAPPLDLPRVTGYLDALGAGQDAAGIRPAPGAGAGSPLPQRGGGTAGGYGSPAPFGSAAGYGSPAGPASRQGVPAAFASPSPAVFGSPDPAPAGGRGPGSPGGADPTPEREPGRSRGMWLGIFGCLGLVILLVIGALVAYSFLRGSGDSSSSTRPTGTTESASAASGRASGDLVSPAPDDAETLDAITAPSGNIHCRLSENSVQCSAASHAVEGTGGTCAADQPLAITVGDGEAEVECGASVEGGTKLGYRRTAVQGDMACRSESTGMTCWNQRTGHGFQLSKSRRTTF